MSAAAVRRTMARRCNGLRFLFHSLIQVRMPALSSVTLRRADQYNLRLVSLANQRPAKFSQIALVGVKCQWKRDGRVATCGSPGPCGWRRGLDQVQVQARRPAASISSKKHRDSWWRCGRPTHSTRAFFGGAM